MQLDQPLTIGNVKLRNRALLAPMSGVSDLPFRELAWKFGAGMVVSEMVASESFVEGEAEMHLKAQSGNLPIHMVQLIGREAQWMGRAAKMIEAQGTDIIDINMGCPARKVTTGYSGSALMRDLDHALRLINAVVESVDVPVTLKMRLGWDRDSINAAELAKRAEDAGVQMITVHGRTRCQFYKGIADWAAIKPVSDAVSIPVIVNGDIVDSKSAERAIEQSGAQAVMVGRASYGAPWLAGEIATSKKLFEEFSPELQTTIIEHYEAICQLYGKFLGVRHARKHLGWYMDNFASGPKFATLRPRILRAEEPTEVISLIIEMFRLSDGSPNKSIAA
ncbi:MAG: tRNA dihydrouridine synthase DusB [Rhizobiaceae bacterium]